MSYTTKVRSKVYHTRKGCIVGKTIKKRNVVGGTKGRQLCKQCKKMR